MLSLVTTKQKGFTAIEITMVATIIAIIALIIIPIFRNRTEEARIAGAKDGLTTIVKAQEIALAETSYNYRLMDLDNTGSFTPTADKPDLEVPRCTWNRVLSSNGRLLLKDKWGGPYTATQSFITLGDLKKNVNDGGRPYMVSSAGNYDGAIFTIANDSDEDKIPTDPWGTPYLFFGTGSYDPLSTTETQYGNAVVFSLGPDGVPGSNITALQESDPNSYLRPNGFLGTGDDISYYF